jgi:hypothetical protein
MQCKLQSALDFLVIIIPIKLFIKVPRKLLIEVPRKLFVQIPRKIIENKFLRKYLQKVPKKYL